uniref:Uncharacterized protein n=1 Tax=Anguilla anguilla TaxID=7936 RepID=A0A0E9TYM9_ANGAN
MLRSRTPPVTHFSVFMPVKTFYSHAVQ